MLELKLCPGVAAAPMKILWSAAAVLFALLHNIHAGSVDGYNYPNDEEYPNLDSDDIYGAQSSLAQQDTAAQDSPDSPQGEFLGSFPDEPPYDELFSQF